MTDIIREVKKEPLSKAETMKRQCYYINPSQDPTTHGGYVPSLVVENVS